uniref:Uncharacterized protein n=1 Tax=Glossina palpalis gambiensis TaxID=67801 RepID=A0A1B0B4R5_9MUSC
MEILVALDPFYNISKSNYGASVTRKYVRVGRLQHLDMKKRQLNNCKYLVLLLLLLLLLLSNVLFRYNTCPSNQTLSLTDDTEAHDNCPNFRRDCGMLSHLSANNRSNNTEHKH